MRNPKVISKTVTSNQTIYCFTDLYDLFSEILIIVFEICLFPNLLGIIWGTFRGTFLIFLGVKTLTLIPKWRVYGNIIYSNPF